MSIFNVLFVLLFSVLSFAGQPKTNPYYGEDFYHQLSTGLRGDELKVQLKAIMQGQHIRHDGQFDEITNNCAGVKGCYSQINLGYDQARIILMGRIHLTQTGKGYAVKDVYCQKEYTSDDFPSGKAVGPDQVPDDRVINIEHTWPQSRFTGRYEKGLQKADMHHLFPSDSKVNGIRGNYEFGEVTQDKMTIKCPISRFGTGSAGTKLIFEPPSEHRGNVARALFYFSLRYDIQISAEEEVVLRKWNREDPIDQDEYDRNEKIFRLQGNRNPFIDHNELVDLVSDF